MKRYLVVLATLLTTQTLVGQDNNLGPFGYFFDFEGNEVDNYVYLDYTPSFRLGHSEHYTKGLYCDKSSKIFIISKFSKSIQSFNTYKIFLAKCWKCNY